MAPLGPFPYREVKRKVEAVGLVEVGHRGSRVKFAKSAEGGVQTAVVPQHREVAFGTLRSIL